MKKLSILLALILVLTSLFCLSACKETSAYELYSSAIEKMNKLDSFDAEMKMDMNMGTEGMSLDIPMSYKISASDIQSKKPKASGTMSMSMMGMNVDSKVYMDESFVYVDTMDQKMKMAIDAEDAEQYNLIDSISEMEIDMPEEVFKEIKIAKTKDGKQSIKISLSQEELLKFLPDFIDEITEGQADSETEDLAISKFDYEIIIEKDGYVSEINMLFEMKAKMDFMGTGETTETTIKCDANVKYANFDKSTVKAPDNLDEYEDYEDMLSADLDLDDEDLGDLEDFDLNEF